MNTKSDNNSKSVLAIILIIIGGLWLLRQVGFPFFHIADIITPIRHVLHGFGSFIFSWPILLIIIGLILLAGKRTSSGFILIAIGGLFILPKIFVIPGLTATIVLPLVLIGLGIALIARIF
jgi:hypothetical protein